MGKTCYGYCCTRRSNELSSPSPPTQTIGGEGRISREKRHCLPIRASFWRRVANFSRNMQFSCGGLLQVCPSFVFAKVPAWQKETNTFIVPLNLGIFRPRLVVGGLQREANSPDIAVLSSGWVQPAGMGTSSLRRLLRQATAQSGSSCFPG